MDPTDFSLVAILLPLLLASGTFSGAETALFGLSQSDLNLLRARHRVAARAVEALLATPTRLLVSILTANMTVNVIYFVIASILTLHAEGFIARTAISLGTLAAIILFGEVLAKLLANSRRVEFCVLFVPLLAAIVRTIAPVVAALDRFVVGPIIRLLRPRSAPALPMSPGELERLLAVSARQGALDPVEHRLLEGVLELGERRVRDVMVPRLEMPVVAHGATLEDAARLCRVTRSGSVPLVGDGVDSGIRGLVDLRRWILAAARRPEPPPDLAAFAAPALFLPDNARLDRALEAFRTSGLRAAICVDEHGAVVGYLERDTLLEGALASHAGGDDDQLPRIEHLEDGSFRVPGRFDAKLFAEIFGLTGEPDRVASRVSTVGGLAVAVLGRVPAEGESINLGRVRARVGPMHRHVPTCLLVRFNSLPAEHPPGGA